MVSRFEWNKNKCISSLFMDGNYTSYSFIPNTNQQKNASLKLVTNLIPFPHSNSILPHLNANKKARNYNICNQAPILGFGSSGQIHFAKTTFVVKPKTR